jgi:Tfp pilus assembly protein PilF
MAPTDVALLTRIASVALRAGRTADAVLALERAVEIEPGEPRHVVSLVTLQLETGDYTGAAVALSRALDRFPADPALLSLGERLRRDVGIR